ncbi:MAG: NUDIX domain-containing protein [Myxococcales bacterium]|nr:NUDIX domain-containing protein [Myxococcales bacterium]
MTKPIEEADALGRHLPRIELEVKSVDPAAPPGFLRLVRRRLIARYPDASESEVFVYDEVDRRALDAVVVAPHYVANGIRYVYLRSALRPPIALRDAERSPIAEPKERGLWELVAGLLEEDEQDAAGLKRCAARELLEETGFDCQTECFRELGPSTYPAPGVIAERHFFFHVEVKPSERGEPTLDGSALEAHAAILPVRLTTALEACRAGQIEDAKTELGLRRLAELELLGRL